MSSKLRNNGEKPNKQQVKETPVVLAIADEDFGQAIIDFATSYKWKTTPVFHLVFAVELDGFPALAPGLATDVETEELGYGEHLLKNAAAIIACKLPSTRTVIHVANSPPSEAILKIAKEVHAEMIVVGSHSRTPLQKFVLGSVSSTVVKNAGCSTMVVRLHNGHDRYSMPGPAPITEEDLPQQMVAY